MPGRRPVAAVQPVLTWVVQGAVRLLGGAGLGRILAASLGAVAMVGAAESPGPLAPPQPPSGDGQTAASLAQRIDLQIHGFLSLGWLGTAGNEWVEGTDHGGTTNFREGAVNVTAAPLDRLRLGAQVYARSLGDYGHDRVRLDWAWADWRFSDALDVQVGRVKIPYGLYHESQDVDAGRTQVFLPVAVYPFRDRDQFHDTDGVRAQGHLSTGAAGSWDWAGVYGVTHIPSDGDLGQYLTDYGLATSFDNITVGPTVAGMAHWHTPLPGLAVRGTGLLVDSYRLDGVSGSTPVTMETSRYYAWVASVLYEWDPLTLTAEYLRNSTTLTATYQTAVGPRPVVIPINQEGMYASLTWQAGERLSFQGTREVGFNDVDAPGSSYSKRWTLACRYDILPNWLVKVEGQLVEGLLYLKPDSTPTDVEDTWQVLAIKTTVDF